MMTESATTQLPAAIAGLQRLALNLRWAWHGPTRDIFTRIDSDLWDATGHNPVRLLAEVDRNRLDALANHPAFVESVTAAVADLNAYLDADQTWYTRRHEADSSTMVAYFCAEFGITECLKIYSGGLGVLAGDHLKSASDLGVPMVGVGLFYSEGYFTQHIDAHGVQHEAYTATDPRLLPIKPVLRDDGAPVMVNFPLADRLAYARVWRADVGRVPLFLLDTNVPENRPEDRRITDRLYGGDIEHRLRQEIVLGIGGMRALRTMGLEPAVIHLNEGHAAFAACERARPWLMPGEGLRDTAMRRAKGVVFTTHTPVAAGHDYFPPELLEYWLGGYVWEMHEPWDRFLSLGRTPHDPRFCMTALALRLSSYRNGVSRLHGEVSRHMWNQLWPEVREQNVPIGHITNGVHLASWVGEDIAAVYADRIGEHWQEDADELHWHRAAHIPPRELWQARTAQRKRMIEVVRSRMAAEARRRGEDAEWTKTALDTDALTLVFARRFATYKRATLFFQDIARLERLLADDERPVQFIFAGKAHPRDEPGQALIREIVAFSRRPEFRDRFVFLEGYDVELARHLVQGADVWLNVPLRPCEASGTSGMKAAANGALNLSIPDGWWAEAWAEHNRLPEPIGWAIRTDSDLDALALESADGARAALDRADAVALYDALETDVVPLFYRQAQGGSREWSERMRSSIRQLGGFFNTHRMVREYVELAYVPAIATILTPVGAARG